MKHTATSESSHGVVMSPEKAVAFLEQVPVLLGFPNAKIILVAPSSSGLAAFSWLMATSHKVEAIIPVAPIGLDKLPEKAYPIISPILGRFRELT